MMSNVGAVFIR